MRVTFAQLFETQRASFHSPPGFESQRLGERLVLARRYGHFRHRCVRDLVYKTLYLLTLAV